MATTDGAQLVADRVQNALADLMYSSYCESFDVEVLAAIFDGGAKKVGREVHEALPRQVDAWVRQADSWEKVWTVTQNTGTGWQPAQAMVPVPAPTIPSVKGVTDAGRASCSARDRHATP